MSGYRADVQAVADEATDDGVDDTALDALVAEAALRHSVDADVFAGDVEERLGEMRAMRDEERSHQEF